MQQSHRLSFGDLPPTSPPHPISNNIFLDYINYLAFDDPTRISLQVRLQIHHHVCARDANLPP